jgi:hypothetical protein
MNDNSGARFFGDSLRKAGFDQQRVVKILQIFNVILLPIRFLFLHLLKKFSIIERDTGF